MLQLDNSKIQQFKACPRKFYFAERYKSKTIEENLEMGTLMHSFIRQHFLNDTSEFDNELMKWYEDMKKRINDSEKFESIDELYSKIKAMIEAYGVVYEEDKTRYDPIQIEEEIQTNISDTNVLYGTPDAVVHDNTTDEIVLFENKTASSIDSSYLEKLPLDIQITTYCYLLAKNGIKVDRIVYNVIRKTKACRKNKETWEDFDKRMLSLFIEHPEEQFYREDLVRDASQVEDFEIQTKEIFSRIQDLRSAPLSRHYQNVANCSMYGSPCQFLQLCLHGEKECAILYDKT